MFKWRELYMRYINLDHRTDRLQHMHEQIWRAGLDEEANAMIRFERERALLTRGDAWNKEPYKVMYNRTAGAVGCMLTQMKVMQDAYDAGKSAWVNEDDLVFCSDIVKRLDYIEKFVNEKEPETDIIWLGGTVHAPAWWHKKGHNEMLQMCGCNLQRDMERTGDERMVRTYGAFSTHSYIVMHKSIPKILDLLKQVMHFSIGIDYSFILHQPSLKCFAFMPGCVKQMDNRSDIGGGMTIFSGFSKLNGTHENSAYWWQDLMEQFDPNTFDWKDASPDFKPEPTPSKSILNQFGVSEGQIILEWLSVNLDRTITVRHSKEECEFIRKYAPCKNINGISVYNVFGYWQKIMEKNEWNTNA